ncbi:amidohydrolase family protein [Klebsiella pneumoniae]|nr:amidohydrolase family protein [Klebsiella pneumoniae]
MINQHGGSSSLRENRCHIWPVKKDDTQSNDIAFFEKAFREQSSRWGLYEIVLGCPGEGNISLYQSVNQGADVPHILIAAGFHGEEPAGCWGMLDFLREGSPELFDNVAVSFLPLVNLSGLSAGCRLNSTGQNPNRGFTNGAEVEPSVEGKVLLNYEALLKNAARHGVLCCHEDILRQQAYLYTFEHTARPGHFSVALRDELERFFPVSLANHSFYFGATNDNLDELKALTASQACGVKVFMGASTGNMLVDDEQVLESIFANAPCLVATHCEHTPTIKQNEAIWRARFGDAIPPGEHAAIRSVDACLTSSRQAVSLAKKHRTRLHVLHITTADELVLFDAAPTLEALRQKTITAEACVHHLFFNYDDYETLGHKLKCNPSVKTSFHQEALWKGVNEGIIDVIATDHAPHLLEEKQSDYFAAPSGLPLVQHALPALLDMCSRGIFTPEMVVRKTSHAVAERFQLKDRGYIREGYWADLVVIDPFSHQQIIREDVAYKCGWSPFEGRILSGGAVDMTLVNGHVIWNGHTIQQKYGLPLEFCR